MDGDIIEMSPKELNSFLLEKYKLGLFEISFILAYILRMGDHARIPRSAFNPDIPITAVLKDLKNRLTNWHKKTIKLMFECEAMLRGGDRISYYRDNKEIIGDGIRISIGRTIRKEEDNYFDFDIDYHPTVHLIDTMMCMGVGAPVKKKTLILIAWGLLFLNCNSRIPWNIIADLLDWFKVRLAECCYCKEFSSSKGYEDINHLKNQYYRNNNKYDLVKGYLSTIRLGKEVLFAKDFVDIIPQVFGSSDKWSKVSIDTNRHYEEGKLMAPTEPLKPWICYVFRNPLKNERIIVFPDFSYFIC